MPNKVLLIDALNLVRRIYAAVPDGDANALYERTQGACQKMVRHHQVTHAILVWDGKDSHHWRQQIYPDYKAHRSPMPEDLASWLPKLMQCLDQIGVHSLTCDGIEADDVIATLTTKLVAHQAHVVIASTDKGFVQLHSDQVQQWNHFDQLWLDADYFSSRFNLPPERLLEFWSLAGDSGNGIPGITGIGAKSAQKLLSEHPIQTLFEEDVVPGKLGEKLRAGKTQAQTSYRLAKLRTELKLDARLNQYRLKGHGS
ncbi:flap endonuclease Xni [Ferrimonas aestuarii]|uniref:Flap endonuclease Xni n=1 Tax=Ferrimonas aestuarii TaxID=2569539 RepID=A0A4U1BR91_9GAMM|nr:flap endonuclease Xni [Ferrimonas aestuarii]TKB56668.1 flap endonuclease Xni [Ferrimonas aestuarii]